MTLRRRNATFWQRIASRAAITAAILGLFAPPVFAAPTLSAKLPQRKTYHQGSDVPTLSAEPVAVGDLVEVTLSGVTIDTAKRSQFICYPKPSGTIFRPIHGLDDSLTILFAAKTAGTYLIGVAYPPDTPTGKVGWAQLEIVVGGSPAPPAPTVQKLKVVVVEETGETTPAWSAVRNSESLRQWAAAGGHAIFFIDKDSPPTGTNAAWWRQVLDHAKVKSLPWIMLYPVGGGDLIAEQAAPPTIAGMQALLETYGGKSKAVKLEAAEKQSACPTGTCPTTSEEYFVPQRRRNRN